MKEVLKILAAGLGAAAVQVADLLTTGSPVTGAIALKILAGTALVRLAMYVVAKYGPQPTPPAA